MNERVALVVALLTGAAGIGVLWAAGVDFPVAVPPGLVVLGLGAVLVAVVRRRWADGVGGLLGLFVLVGFVVSGFAGDGFENISGQHGAAVAAGQVVQLLGVLAAAVTGAVLVRRGA